MDYGVGFLVEGGEVGVEEEFGVGGVFGGDGEVEEDVDLGVDEELGGVDFFEVFWGGGVECGVEGGEGSDLLVESFGDFVLLVGKFFYL